MKRLLREPLLHFLLLGAALFAVFASLSGREAARPDAIVVTAGKIEHLAALFERTWQRPPTRGELAGLVNDFVREEIAYRESLAIGLDRDDTVLRRRMRQKLEFVAEDIASRAEPTEAELAAYLAAHPESFRTDPRLTFRQVYLDPAKRGDDLQADARALLEKLNDEPALDADALGDRILLEHRYEDIAAREVAALFGDGFAGDVLELSPGAWGGPIGSGYGLHLVRIDERKDGRLPELAEIREAVRREWEHDRREETIERFYQEMRGRYEVVIEWPEPGAGLEGS